MRFLQQFDRQFHTPNERRLAVALKGRSVEADRLMNDLACRRQRDTAMLFASLQLVAAPGRRQRGADGLLCRGVSVSTAATC